MKLLIEKEMNCVTGGSTFSIPLPPPIEDMLKQAFPAHHYRRGIHIIDPIIEPRTPPVHK